jgi:WD40 repeat protein
MMCVDANHHQSAAESSGRSAQGARIIPAKSEQKILGPVMTELRQRNVVEIAWSADGQRIATTSNGDKNLVLWDARTGRAIRRQEKAGTVPRTIAFSPDGQYLVSASLLAFSFKQSFALLNGHTGELIRHLTAPEVGLPFWPLEAAVADPKGHFMALRFAGNGAPTVLALYDVKTWQPTRILVTPNLPEDRSKVPPFPLPPMFYINRQLLISSDGRYLAQIGILSQNGDNVVQILSTDQREKPRNILVIPSISSVHIQDIAFSPDGQKLAVGLSNTDAEHLKIVDVATGAVIRTYPTLPIRSINGVGWSPDGRLIVTLSNDLKLRMPLILRVPLRSVPMGQCWPMHRTNGLRYEHCGTANSKEFSRECRASQKKGPPRRGPVLCKRGNVRFNATAIESAPDRRPWRAQPKMARIRLH